MVGGQRYLYDYVQAKYLANTLRLPTRLTWLEPVILPLPRQALGSNLDPTILMLKRWNFANQRIESLIPSRASLDL